MDRAFCLFNYIFCNDTAMTKQKIEKKVSELKSVLKFFSKLKTPLYTRDECPFGDEEDGNLDHNSLSRVVGDRVSWRWNCLLCGWEEQE